MCFLSQRLSAFYISFLFIIFYCSCFQQGWGADDSKFYKKHHEEKEKKPKDKTPKPISMDTTFQKDSGKIYKKFKVGFEFQTSGIVLSDEITNDPSRMVQIQKKPIFKSVDKKGEELWHVEIDGTDIEFVSVPFSDEMEDELKLSLAQIQQACDELDSLLKKQEKVSIGAWVANLGAYPKINVQYCHKQKDVLRSPLNPYMLKFKKRKNYKNITFNPQVTIQYPLEKIMPLFFGLFGFDDVVEMRRLSTSIPNYDLLYGNILDNHESFQKAVQSTWPQHLITKISGLAFLHAFTMTNMAISASSAAVPDVTTGKKQPLTDGHLLLNIEAEIAQQGNGVLLPQIDAKRNITFMSRRPFSSMFKNIEEKIKYLEYFTKNLEENNKYFNYIFEVPKYLCKANYGEQFYDKNGVLDLSHSENLIEKEFYSSYKDLIDRLLKRGIVTMSIIRNLKQVLMSTKEYFEPLWIERNYYKYAVESVQDPTHRYNLKVKGGAIELEKSSSHHDMLSPPWFLDDNNAMGYLKDDTQIDKRYGEAIVEIRGIKRVGEWFLKRVSSAENGGSFLVFPDKIESQGALLFKFLNNFLIDNNILKDIHVGLCYSAIKISS